VDERRRWTILAVGTLAQTATCCFIYGVPMLVPQLLRDGLSLFGASLLVSAPVAGVLLTLIVWGAAADRYGERVVIVTGVALASIALAVGVVAPGVTALGIALGVAGAFGASVNAASGRVVMGWFPKHERGLAMGARQTAQPLGVALAALVLPGVARAHGVHLAMLFPTLLCAAAALAVLLFVADPPRDVPAGGQPPARSPYRGSPALVRVHLASALLVVPQFAVAGFTLAYLVHERGWDPAVAGRLVFAFQLAGAFGRVAAGVWSDRVASRLGPMRQLAVASSLTMGLIALGASTGSWVVVLGFALGAVITVADNGLAYTSVAELAGRAWSGRALGIQNTGQNLAAVATPPVLAALIGGAGYGWGFALVAAFPLLAIPMTPVRTERARSSSTRSAVAAQR
jgi:sugar phosphate permease